jgi:hypothetical protein
MNTQELKLTIHELVNMTDDPEILKGIFLLLKKLRPENDDFMGFEADGSGVTTSDFIQSIKDADADIDAGNGISHAAMKAKYKAA